MLGQNVIFDITDIGRDGSNRTLTKGQGFRCGKRNLSCAQLPRTGAYLACSGRKEFGCWSPAESRRRKQAGPCSHVNSVTLWELEVCLGRAVDSVCSLSWLFLNFSSWANFRCDILKHLPSFLLGEWGGEGHRGKNLRKFIYTRVNNKLESRTGTQPSGIALVSLVWQRIGVGWGGVEHPLYFSFFNLTRRCDHWLFT